MEIFHSLRRNFKLAQLSKLESEHLSLRQGNSSIPETDRGKEKRSETEPYLSEPLLLEFERRIVPPRVKPEEARHRDDRRPPPAAMSPVAAVAGRREVPIEEQDSSLLRFFSLHLEGTEGSPSRRGRSWSERERENGVSWDPLWAPLQLINEQVSMPGQKVPTFFLKPLI